MKPKVSSDFLPILPVRDVLQLTGVAPAVDDAVGCAWVDAGGCGGFSVGLGVAFGLEHKADTAVVTEALIDGCGGGVRRDEKHPIGGSSGFSISTDLFLITTCKPMNNSNFH